MSRSGHFDLLVANPDGFSQRDPAPVRTQISETSFLYTLDITLSLIIHRNPSATSYRCVHTDENYPVTSPNYFRADAVLGQF